MALTYGIESLAVINKDGGIRRLASSDQTTDYLRGDLTWTAFPTTTEPSTHTHDDRYVKLDDLFNLLSSILYAGNGIFVHKDVRNNKIIISNRDNGLGLILEPHGLGLQLFNQ